MKLQGSRKHSRDGKSKKNAENNDIDNSQDTDLHFICNIVVPYVVAEEHFADERTKGSGKHRHIEIVSKTDFENL